MIFIVYVVGALLALVYLVIVYLLVQRAIRYRWSWYVNGRIQKFEPLLFNLLDTPTALGPLTHGLRPFDRAIIERLLLKQANELAGEDRDNMTQALEEAGYVDEMVGKLRSRRWWRRLEAASKLGVMKSRKGIPALLKACEDPVEGVRLAAAVSLAEMHDTSVLGYLFEAMEDASHWTPERVADVVWTFAMPQSRDVPEEIKASVRAEVRSQIVRTTDSKARQLYIRTARRLEDVEALDILCEMIGHSDVGTRVQAASALGGIPDPRSADKLIAALGDQERVVRAEAARSLGILQDPRAIESLAQCLRDPSREVRYNAAWAVNCMGPAGEDVILAAAQDGDSLVRNTAAQILAEKRLGVDSQRV